MKHQKIRGKWYLAGLAVCVLLLGVSLFQVISHYAGAQKAEKEFTELAQIVEQTEDTPEEEPAGEEQEVISPLERYAELFAMNNDMAGWIRIEDTQINYPVMYTPDNPDYYLKHNFEGKDDNKGNPFVSADASIDPMDQNIVIFGHNVSDGSQFGDLDAYLDKKFYKKHPVITFDTIYETGQYQIVAVVKTHVKEKDESGFRYYWFRNYKNRKEFQNLLDFVEENRVYDTGEHLIYGDTTIMLSTCEYTVNNGRLVVIAKRI